VDIFFDGMKPITHEHNKNIITLLKWLRFLLWGEMNAAKRDELWLLKDELEDSVQSW